MNQDAFERCNQILQHITEDTVFQGILEGLQRNPRIYYLRMMMNQQFGQVR